MGNSIKNKVAESFSVKNRMRISKVLNKRDGVLPNPSKQFPFQEHMKTWNINQEAAVSTGSTEIEEEKPPIIINVEKYSDLMKHLQSSDPLDVIEQAH